MEVERNLQDAMQVIRNVVLEPRLLPGGGAAEMAVSRALRAAADAATGVDSYPLRAVADAMEVIPRILATNCGAKVVRVLTELRAKQQTEGPTWGIDLCGNQPGRRDDSARTRRKILISTQVLMGRRARSRT